MPSDFSTTIAAIASTFAADVLSAIRGASVEEIRLLAADVRATPRGQSPVKASGRAPSPPARVTTGATPGSATDKGRLHRRSPAELAKALDKVVALLKVKGGQRSEQIQKQLGMDKRELPRVLKLGLERRALKSKGERRSTVYSAS